MDEKDANKVSPEGYQVSQTEPILPPASVVSPANPALAKPEVPVIPPACGADEFVDHDACVQLWEQQEPSSPIYFPDAHTFQVGEHVFTYRSSEDGKGETIHFTPRQFTFLTTLIESNNPHLAAKKSGATLEQAIKWFQNKKFRKYFDERKKERALALGLTGDFLNALAYDVLNGRKELSRTQVKVWEALFKKFNNVAESVPETIPLAPATPKEQVKRIVAVSEQWEIVSKKPKEAVDAEIVQDTGNPGEKAQ